MVLDAVVAAVIPELVVGNGRGDSDVESGLENEEGDVDDFGDGDIVEAGI